MNEQNSPDAVSLETEPQIVPAETINPKHVDRDAIRVIRRLRQFGFEAYLVGGCVRDLLLDKAPKDFDIITSATPHEVHKIFSNSRIIGRRFRLVHILLSNKILEVSTFRNESTSGVLGKGKPRIPKKEIKDAVMYDNDPNYFGTPSKDAHRRDFTINALFFDPESNLIIDYVGGLEDMKKRIVRSIRDPQEALQEDPVRALRAARFAAKLNFTIEPKTLEAIKHGATLLPQCSQRRVFEEILKILGGGYSAPTLKLLSDFDILRFLIPPVAAWIGDDKAVPERSVFIDELIDEETVEEEADKDLPIFFERPAEPVPDIKTTVAKKWEPARFLVDAMVQVCWNRAPMEGSSEWNEDPDDEVFDDVFEVSAFQRDYWLGKLNYDASMGLEAEREKARAALKVLKSNDMIETKLEQFVIDNLQAGRVRTLVEHLIDPENYQEIVSRRDQFLRYLNGLDLLYRLSGEISTTLMLATIFAPVLRHQLKHDENAKLAELIDALLTPLSDRNCLSKRDRDQTTRLLLLHMNTQVAPRLRRARQRKRRSRPTMKRRSQYSDALILKWLECRTHGLGWVEFLQWEEAVYAPAVGVKPATSNVSLSLEKQWD